MIVKTWEFSSFPNISGAIYSFETNSYIAFAPASTFGANSSSAFGATPYLMTLTVIPFAGKR